MTKLWLAATALSTALMTSGCVIVVDGDDDGVSKMRHDARSSDGYIVLDRDGDYTRLSGDLNLRGRIGGDLSLVSGDVDIDRLDVGGDVSIAAGDVNFSGTADGEVSIAGGDVRWSGLARDELSIAAGDLRVSGRVEGEAALAAGDMNVDAVFLDELSAQAGTLRFSGEVSGPVRLVAINEIRRNRDYSGDDGLVAISGRLHDGGEVCAIRVSVASSARLDGRLVVYAESEPDLAGGARADDLVYMPRNGRDCDDLIGD